MDYILTRFLIRIIENFQWLFIKYNERYQLKLGNLNPITTILGNLNNGKTLKSNHIITLF